MSEPPPSPPVPPAPPAPSPAAAPPPPAQENEPDAGPPSAAADTGGADAAPPPEAAAAPNIDEASLEPPVDEPPQPVPLGELPRGGGSRIADPAAVPHAHCLAPLDDYVRARFRNERIAAAIRIALARRAPAWSRAAGNRVFIAAAHRLLALMAVEQLFDDRPVRVLTVVHPRVDAANMPVREFGLRTMIAKAAPDIREDDIVVVESWGLTREEIERQIENAPPCVLVLLLDQHADFDCVNLESDGPQLVAEIAVGTFGGEPWAGADDALAERVADLSDTRRQRALVVDMLNQPNARELRASLARNADSTHVAALNYDAHSPTEDPRYAAALFVGAHFPGIDAQTFVRLAGPLAKAVPVRGRTKEEGALPDAPDDEVVRSVGLRFLYPDGTSILCAPDGVDEATAALPAQTVADSARRWFLGRRLLRDSFVDNLALRLVHGSADNEVASCLAKLEIEAFATSSAPASTRAERLTRLFYGYLPFAAEAPSGIEPADSVLAGQLHESMARAPGVMADLLSRLPQLNLGEIVRSLTCVIAAAPRRRKLVADACARLFWMLYLNPGPGVARPSLADFVALAGEDEGLAAHAWSLVRALDRIAREEGRLGIVEGQHILTDVGRHGDVVFASAARGEAIFSQGLRFGLLQPLRGASWTALADFCDGADAVALVETGWRAGDLLANRCSARPDGEPDPPGADAEWYRLFAAFLSVSTMIEVVAGSSALEDLEMGGLDAWVQHLIPGSDVGFHDEELWRYERGPIRFGGMGRFEQAVATLHLGIPVAVAMLACARREAADRGPTFTIPDELGAWLCKPAGLGAPAGKSRAAILHDRIVALGSLSGEWAQALNQARLRPSPVARSLWEERRVALRGFAQALPKRAP